MRAKRLQTKFRLFYDRLEICGEKQSCKWLVWGLYTLITIIFAFRHEPWYDEYHAWGMVNQMDFVQLWKAMRIEGHFVLWHLCLWPFVKWFGMDWHCLYCVSVPLMSLAAWLLLFKVRFPFVGKLLVIFSAPFFYYYPVISRCYALIPPIMMGLVVLYQQKKHPLLYCVLIGLLANTHAYMEGLVAVLWCLFVWKCVWKIRKTNPDKAKRNALAATTTLLLVFFAFIQVAMGLMDMAKGWKPGGGGPMEPKQWLQRFNYCYQINICHYLKNYVSVSIPDFDLLFTLCGYVMVIILSHLVFQSYDNKKRKESLVILFCALAWQVLFASNFYGPHIQMTLLLFFSLLMVWLFYYPLGKPKYICLSLFCLWLLHTSSSYDVIKDLWVTIDPSVNIAKEIESDLPDECDTLYYKHWVIKDLIPRKTVKLSPKVISKFNKAEKMDAWCLILGEEPIQLENYTVDEIGSYQIYLAKISRFDGQKLHLYHITK